MIILKFKKNEAMILNSGRIYKWPGISDDEEKGWSFVGVAKTKKGDYAYHKREMIEQQIMAFENTFYPVLCDSCGNFAVLKDRIEEIQYDDI